MLPHQFSEWVNWFPIKFKELLLPLLISSSKEVDVLKLVPLNDFLSPMNNTQREMEIIAKF